MPKKLLFNEKARTKLLKGAKIVADAVGSTLGPKANNVAIERPFGAPSVLHDGVSVAKEIDLKDPDENLGAQLIKEAAQKTNDKAGDGTTTATILTYAMTQEAIKNIAAGANAMMLKKGMELAVKDIVRSLKRLARKIKTNDEIKNIATISAQDETIGNLITSAIKKLGKKCIIVVEESAKPTMEMEYKEGMQFDKGWVSPYFVTNPETMEAIIEDAWIMITDAKITTNAQFIEWAKNIENQYSEGKPQPQMPKNIVVIASEVSGIALASMIQNKMQGFLNILAVQAPQYGEAQKDILRDIAVVTNGNFISEEAGGSLATMKLQDFGHAKRVVSTKDSTIIVDGEGSKEGITHYTHILEELLNKTTSEFEKEKLEERIAKLTSGIAVINVGAPSEMEMKEKKERCIDAIEATKAAIEEGIVRGGEVAYLAAINGLQCESAGDIKTGYNLVLKAVVRPFEVLMENSGYDSGMMLERLQATEMGIDVRDGIKKDMIKAGIIDPVKVSRVALQNALSCACSIMTTNCLITDIKENKDDSGTISQTQ